MGEGGSFASVVGESGPFSNERRELVATTLHKAVHVRRLV